MKRNKKNVPSLFVLFLVLASLLSLPACVTRSDIQGGRTPQVSEHFDGVRYLNPGVVAQGLSSLSGQTTKRGSTWWVWKWIFRAGWPEWPEETGVLPGPRPVARAPEGSIYVTPIGHATFLIDRKSVV